MPFRSRFSMKRKLGQALYGGVYLCADARRDGDLVAVKEVNLRDAKRRLNANPHMDNPWQERKIAEQLTEIGAHENVLQFHDNFMENGAWFIAMQYCNQGDLLGCLQDNNEGRMAECTALDYFRQVAQGLSFLHLYGVAHRDLSLENVLLHDGVCKLSDFGLSTDSDRICKERVGKAYYMAPEVVAEQEYDPKAADMWSLGIMLFIMLTGSPLVQMASKDDKAFLALQTFGVEKILDVWGMSSMLTPETMELLASLLNASPAKRPTVDELLRHAALERP